MSEKIIKSLSLILVIGIFGLFFSVKNIWALGYGEGTYGTGIYNIGGPTPTAVPTPNPTSNPTDTPSSDSGNSNSSSSSSGDGGGGSGGCSASAPGVPDLFQIDAGQNQVMLFITRPAGSLNKYTILYGYDQTVSQFNTTVDLNSAAWITPVIINQLAANTVYHFQAKAVNDCVPGAGSQTLGVKTAGNAKVINKYYKNSGFIGKAVSRIKSFVAKVTTKPKTVSAPEVVQQNPDLVNPPSEITNTRPLITSAPTAKPKQESGFFSSVVKTVKGWFSY